jgi:hypothetical protein
LQARLAAPGQHPPAVCAGAATGSEICGTRKRQFTSGPLACFDHLHASAERLPG